jgi:hypothetical protein
LRRDEEDDPIERRRLWPIEKVKGKQDGECIRRPE